MPVEVTEATFKQEIETSRTPVVLEFHATWCGNCRRIAPTLNALADEFAPRVRFATINADEEPALVSRFGVSSTPSLFVLTGGKQLTSLVGAQPEPILRALFETAASETEWVRTDACTLPAAGQSARLAEFEDLFRTSLSAVNREAQGWLRLRLHGDAEQTARDLTAREAECCSFFDFTVTRDDADVLVDVRVPTDKIAVLDGLTAQAEAAVAHD